MPRGPCWRHPSDWILSGGVTMASEALRCRAGSPYPATPDDMAGSSDSTLHPTPSLRLTSLRMKTPVKAGPCPPGPSTLTPVAPAGLLFLPPKPELHRTLSETAKVSPRHAHRGSSPPAERESHCSNNLRGAVASLAPPPWI